MSIKLYFHTLRYLKFSQILWRLYYRFIAKPLIDLSPAPALRNHIGNLRKPIEKNIKMLEAKKFIFLNEIHEIQGALDWNNPTWAKLWLYNLHYFDDLNCKEAKLRKQWHKNLINIWIQDNPPGFGNGWEPYPISLRIVNWIKWSLISNSLEDHILLSLAVQARYLMQRLEYHLLGNHLFVNAKALIYVGLFFTGNEANVWFNKGLQILQEQLPEQVLSDGGNFELSPMYHAIFLEDLLDIINIYNCYGIIIPEQIIDTVRRMFFWLLIMTHPNGEFSFFNDTANAISASTKELEDYAQILGLDLEVTSIQKNKHLIDSGYVRIEKGELTAILDIAAIGSDYIPGHAHADSLSFECSLFKQKIIVNSGTSLYGTSKERLRQRGTKAHSTLAIDDKDSSEVWGGFRVARRARILDSRVESNDDRIVVSASHDGYCRLNGKLKHSRQWILTEQSLEVIDIVQGKGKHKIEIIYHLAPEISILNKGINFIELLANKQKVMMKFDGKGELFIEPSTYHPEFGLSIENRKIIWVQLDCQLPFKVRMILLWK